VECRDKGDCTDPLKPYCNAGICSALCDDDTDCSPKVCKTTTGQCVTCTTNAHCAATPSTPVCNPATNTCVRCVTHGDCAGEALKKLCHPTSLQCVECLANADCGAVGVCSSRNVCLCKPCTGADQCGGERCLDVTGPGRWCSQTCGNDGDCPDGFDCSSGLCEPAEKVSCQALADVGKSCSADTQCGLGDDDHGRTLGCPANFNTVFCRMGEEPHICTFRCDEEHDCPPGYTCIPPVAACLGARWCLPQ
jgi:hypothetical protein